MGQCVFLGIFVIQGVTEITRNSGHYECFMYFPKMEEWIINLRQRLLSLWTIFAWNTRENILRVWIKHSYIEGFYLVCIFKLHILATNVKCIDDNGTLPQYYYHQCIYFHFPTNISKIHLIIRTGSLGEKLSEKSRKIHFL